MNKPIRTISVFVLLLFVALMVNATYVQYWSADALDHDPNNRRAIDANFSRDRGSILVGQTAIARSVPSKDRYQYQREYTKPYMYAHITGWFNYFNAAGGECETCQQRVEQTYNDVLSGDDDRLLATRLVDLLSNKQTKGGNVELTIDPAAQKAAYDALSNVLGPGGEGAVVAVQPRTGKVLAMVSLPTFDPNKLASHDTTQDARVGNELDRDPTQPLLNRAIQTTLPPGSTFKLVTAAAAIESGKYDENSLVPGGATYQLPQTSGNSGLVDNEGRDCGTGKIPFALALENSCNTTFAHLAVDLGSQAMTEQAQKFGFDDSSYFTDLLPVAGSRFPTKMNPPQTGQSGIGQYDVAATPLQMAMVAAGIANGGVVMKPYLVDEVQSPDFERIEGHDPEELSQAVSSSTAQQLTDLMVKVVDDGTAYPAAIPGIKVAGKTGTAQSGTDAPPYAWFTSFAPADDPQVAVAVMIQKAPGVERGEIAGGALGGPVAKAIMEAVIQGG